MWVDSDVTYSLEEALLYLKYLNGGFGFYKHTAFHFTRCCLMNWSGWLWCFYYQLFGLSFWRHPFTAEHPLMSKSCNAAFQICSDEGKSVRRKEVSCSHLFTKIKTSEHLQRSCLCFLKVNGAFKYENPSSMKAQCMSTLAVTLTHCRCKRCETGSIYLLICPLSHFLILTAPIHCRGSIGEQVM